MPTVLGGAMCGNGIRCVGKYVYDRKLTRKTCLTIDTDAGPRGLELAVRGGKAEQVTVDMGQAILYPEVELEAMGEAVHGPPGWSGEPSRRHFLPRPREGQAGRTGPGAGMSSQSAGAVQCGICVLSGWA